MTSYRLNEQHKGVEVLFESKPSAQTIDALKAGGFRWHRGGGYWYAKQSADTITLAEKLTGGAASSADVPSVPAEEYHTTTSAGYMGAVELTGSQYAAGRRLYGAELSKAIREAFKRCGISGATVRVKTFSGGQEIVVTLTAAPSDVVSEAEYVETCRDDLSGYWFTTPSGEQVHRDAMPWGDTDAARAILDHTHKTEHQNIIKELSGSYGYSVYKNGEGVFVPRFCAKIEAVQRILNAFNHDDSNGMVDYFDRHFYDTIKVKF